MNPNEIDDALRSDPGIEPSPAFQVRVMRAVHDRAVGERPRVRVWRVIWPSLAAASVVVPLLIAVKLLELAQVQPGDTIEIVRWMTLTLTGTFAVAWKIATRVRA